MQSSEKTIVGNETFIGPTILVEILIKNSIGVMFLRCINIGKHIFKQFLTLMAFSAQSNTKIRTGNFLM